LPGQPSYGIVRGGKGGEGRGIETTPIQLELTPAVRSSHPKGNQAMAKKKKKKKMEKKD